MGVRSPCHCQQCQSILEAEIVSERVRTLYMKDPTAMSPNCSVPSTWEKLSLSLCTDYENIKGINAAISSQNRERHLQFPAR